jgi:hypothetical protein
MIEVGMWGDYFSEEKITFYFMIKAFYANCIFKLHFPCLVYKIENEIAFQTGSAAHC